MSWEYYQLGKKSQRTSLLEDYPSMPSEARWIEMGGVFFQAQALLVTQQGYPEALPRQVGP